eukprot:TRINITY_DN4373_c0_g1_i3.p1 TRINITY_DN4373_c0_g1~~TRINITY_DN4373_c0_g1_i3.p1  ORF type:complete len:312 (-),score=68.06 TRINITY_DN4373_c0_g1_i3:526-1392(-)
MQQRGRSPRQSALDDAYLRACARCGHAPDTGVLICLRVGAEVVKPSHALCDEGLVPLGEALAAAEEPVAVRQLVLSKCNISSSGALLLAKLLSENSFITHLDLSCNNIGVRGFKALAQALETNDTLTHFDLHKNKCFATGALVFAEAVRAYNHQLEYLDMSDVHMGYEGCKYMEEAATACNSRRAQITNTASDFKKKKAVARIEVVTTCNFDREELLNWVTHGIGLVMGVIATTVLVRTYWGVAPPLAMAAGVAYCATMVAVYFNSFFYHIFFKYPTLKNVRPLFTSV